MQAACCCTAGAVFSLKCPESPAHTHRLPQEPSPSPYAHWSWYQYGFAASQDPLLNCVTAWGDLAYETFYGDANDTQQLGSIIFYQTAAGSALKHGWTPAPCNTTLPFFCQLPTALYPCHPPPSPPAPPPQPPSPPAPPAPPTCACLSLGSGPNCAALTT